MIIEVQITEANYDPHHDKLEGYSDNEWVPLDSLPDIVRRGDMRYGNINEVTRESLRATIMARASVGRLEGEFAIRATQTSEMIPYGMTVKYRCILQ